MLRSHQTPGNPTTGLQTLCSQQAEDGLCAGLFLFGLLYLLLLLLMTSHRSQGSLRTVAQMLGLGRLEHVLWAGRMILRQSPESLQIGRLLGQMEAVAGVAGQASLIVMMVTGLLEAALEACMHKAQRLYLCC